MIDNVKVTLSILIIIVVIIIITKIHRVDVAVMSHLNSDRSHIGN